MTPEKLKEEIRGVIQRAYDAGVVVANNIPAKTGLGMVIAGEIIPEKGADQILAATGQAVLEAIGPDWPLIPYADTGEVSDAVKAVNYELQQLRAKMKELFWVGEK